MSEVNIPLLRKVVEWAESEEKLELQDERKWNQMHWFIQYDRSDEVEYQSIDCGTAYCIAGYIAIELEGWKPIMSVVDSTTNVIRHPRTGRQSTISKVALEALGMDDGTREYHEIFEPNNDARAIRNIAEDLAGERL